MAPRRTRKVGLKRIDAAVDACGSMGFSPSVVRSKVKQLLKEYGGDEGWVFIEEGSYKVLIEAMLEDQEKQEEGCDDVGALPWQEDDEKPVLDDIGQPGLSIAMTSNAGLQLACPEQDSESLKSKAGLELLCSKQLAEVTNPGAVSVLGLLPPQEMSQRSGPEVQRRRRHFGWVSSGKNNHEDNYVLLAPYPVGNHRADGQSRRQKGTRWDLNP